MNMISDIDEIIISEEEIGKKVSELASKISADYNGKELSIISILRGASIFLADLTRELENINFTLDFLVLTRGGSDGSGEVKIIKDLDYSILGKHVLILEDMIDMGESLHYVMEVLKLRKPLSIKICTLFEKPCARESDFTIDYRGFILPDQFVVGYGLDYRQKYRNLPFVGTLRKKTSPYKS